MTTPPQERRSFLTEGVLLAMSSVAAYVFAFVFEISYAEHFGIPYWLIEVGWIEVLLAWVALLAALVAVGVLAYMLGSTLPASSASGFRRPVVALTCAFLVIGLFGWVLMSVSERYWEGVFLASIAAASLSLLLAELYRLYRTTPAQDSWTSRWAAAARMFDSRPSVPAKRDSVVDTLLSRQVMGRRVSFHVRLFLTLFALLFVLPMLLGRLSTRRETSCLVTHELRDWIAIRKYGDFIVAMPLDPKTMTITRSFTLFPVIDSSRVWSTQGKCQLGLLPIHNAD
jgi:hypothetical protein